MRIIFIGKHHDYTLLPLRAALRQHELVGLVESAPRKAGCASQSPRWWNWLSRRAAPATTHAQPTALQQLADSLHVPYYYLDRGGLDALACFLRQLQPDVVCTFSLSQLLPAELLDVPRWGFLNGHPSLLPKYHGPFPWFWQYYHDEREFGMTIHRIDAGQDTGPILAQRPFPVARGTEIEAAMRQAAELGAELLCQALRDLEQGRARFVPQPAHQYPKARVVRPDEPLVEWEAWDVERVWHFLRGTRPWLRPVRLPPGVPWRIGNFETRPPECPPATIGADKQGYYIAHRQGRIRLAA